MVKINNILLSVIFLLLTSLGLLASSVYAAGDGKLVCRQVYGGGVICEERKIDIDKFVLNPQTNEFVDNLGRDHHRFKAGEEVRFRIRVRNVGDLAVANLTIRDFLPVYLEASGGDFSGKGGTTELAIGELKPGEEAIRELRVRVVSEDRLLVGVQCDIANTAVIVADDKEFDRDIVTFCTERQVKEVVRKEQEMDITELPPTGPTTYTVILWSSLGLAVTGIALLVFAKK